MQTIKSTEELSLFEEMIRQGRSHEVRARIRKLTQRRPNRQACIRIAGFCHRVGLAHVGLRLLRPIVIPDRKKSVVPNADEKTEYAQCLVRLGAIREGRQLLESIDSSLNPRVLLYRAFAHIKEWDYQGAIPILEKYLRASHLTEYQQNVAWANLVSSYVAEGRFNEAKLPLDRLLRESERDEFRFLRGSLLELSAQIGIETCDFSLARQNLRESEKLFLGSGLIEELFLEKWKAILLLSQSRTRKEGLRQIIHVRKRAAVFRHWETIRDCDYQLAKFKNNRSLLIQLFVGTPYPSFRNRVSKILGAEFKIPDEYDWELGVRIKRQVPKKQISLCVREPLRGVFQGAVPMRVWQSLCRDFYRPQRLAEIFYQVYPTENFEPRSAALRIHQSLHLLRRIFVENRIPLEISENERTYFLANKRTPIILTLRTNGLYPTQKEERAAKIFALFGNGPFSATELAAKLGFSRRSTVRFLNSELSNGRLIRFGGSRQTRYKCVSQN